MSKSGDPSEESEAEERLMIGFRCCEISECFVWYNYSTYDQTVIY